MTHVLDIGRDSAGSRGTETFTFLRAANTGHPGWMTTIHADDPSWAIEQHALLATSASSLHREDVIGYANKVIDVIVQLERQHGTRSIREILWRDAPRS